MACNTTMQFKTSKFSFRIRTVLILLAFQSAFLLGYGYLLYGKNEQIFRDEFFERLETVNRTLSATLAPLVEKVNEDELRIILEQIRLKNKLSYIVYRSEKKPLTVGDPQISSVPIEDLARRQSELKVLDHFVALESSTNIQREIQIGYPVTPLENNLAQLKKQFYIGLFLMTLGLGMVVLLILRFLFRRLTKIEAACTEVSKGNLDALIGENGTDEIGRIAHSFDQMTLAVKNSLAEQEHQRAKLVDASRLASLGTMAGGIAHEINNPLTIIQLTAERCLLLLDRPDQLDKLRTAMDRILATVARIARIVQGLRSFSRSSEGFIFTSEPLVKVLDDVISLGNERIKTLGINLEIAVPDDIYLKLDRVRFGQVVINLLNNSIDAISEASHQATRENLWIRIEATRQPTGVCIRFIDSGHGIAPDVLEKLMTPFFTTKPIGQGTGLGLSISKGIIESHGGQLSYESGAKNTTFRIDFPLSVIPGAVPSLISSTKADSV